MTSVINKADKGDKEGVSCVPSVVSGKAERRPPLPEDKQAVQTTPTPPESGGEDNTLKAVKSKKGGMKVGETRQ